MPSVSVIIRARNEDRYLGHLLERIREQNGPSAEIVVVDSGSTDRTIDIAERGADQLVHIAPGEFTFGRSLNYGCAAASGEIFAIASAHTYPSSNNWLLNLTAPFEDPKVAMVYGRQLPHETTRVGEARDFAVTYPAQSRVLIDEPFGNNANSAVRASLWREHHFDEALTGLEDIEWARWAQRREYTVWYAANAAIVHIHDESLRQVYKRYQREGRAHGGLFPHARGDWSSFLLEGAVDAVRDVRFARSVAAPARDVMLAPLFRASATLGFYRGGLARERLRSAAARAAISNGRPSGRAVIVSGPGRHELAPREPAAPRPGEVVVRVAYVGVCATDVEVAEGTQAYYREERARFPIVPGHEYSGVVESVGSDDLRDWIGARVVGECVIGCATCTACLEDAPTRCASRLETGVLNKDGAYASHVTVPDRALHRLPDGLPLLTSALVEPTAVVLKALRKSRRPLRGANAAVVGAGPIGHIAAQLLRRFGADVLVIDRNEARLWPFAGMAYSTATEISKRALARVDTVVEATGDERVLQEIAATAEPDAQVIAIGVPGEDGARIPLQTENGGPTAAVASLASDHEDWTHAIRLLSTGDPDLSWLLDHVAPLESYGEAWDDVRNQRRLKTVLRVNSELASE